MASERPRIVIIGAGFGGLNAARELKGSPVEVLLIDRNNFHTFTPLLYQVATCGLDPGEVAYPVRGIFRGKDNVRVLFGDVTALDTGSKQVMVHAAGKTNPVPYDFLIVAAGSVTNFFGSAALERHAFGLKDLADAVTLRNHILRLFEEALWAEDAARRRALLTLVVVGGGPTGLETAGALYELYNDVLQKEYGGLPRLQARVMLIEATDRLLAPYPLPLRNAARQQLESLGVEVVLGQAVEAVEADHIRLQNGQVIQTHTLVWAAGVTGSPLAHALGVPLQRGGRVPVEPTLQVSGLADVYAVGDIAYLLDPAGQPYPQVIPVAQQQGRLAAANIVRRSRGWSEQTFVYRDRGIMATIGRSRAVAWVFYRLQLTGYLAWVAWLGLHLLWLLGFRNRLVVLVNWVWNYLTYDRSVRIILERQGLKKVRDEAE